ncbi:MAG TPA: DoxX family protein [Thermoanaerobaculia bacterium]|nr:DoxX family protein [Thermoanaerobaculia bacterium]
MWKRLLSTDDNTAALIARLTIALVIFPHGAQKLFGWFGGHGFAGTMDFFTRWGFPSFLVFLLIVTESIGMLLLAAGFLGRLWAAATAVVMVVAVWKARHFTHFFMNWYMEARRPEGFEYHLLVMGLVLIVLIFGSGRWSADRALSRNVSP